MPLDLITGLSATYREFWRAPDARARLAMLAEALENPPSSHAFYFPDLTVRPQSIGRADCNTAGCAIGLAKVLWGASFPDFTHEDRCVRVLFSNFGERFTINPIYGCRHCDITPGMVASAIRYYLETGKIPCRRIL